MAKEFSRSRRVGELLQRELAGIIQRELRIPGMGMITVSHVDVSPDLKRAKVFVTQLGGDLSVKALLAGLEEATPELRHFLAHSVNLRNTPRLNFTYDSSIEEGSKLSALIASVRPREESED